MKQLKRTKKMEVQSWSNIEDTAALFSETSKEIKEDGSLISSNIEDTTEDPLCKTAVKENEKIEVQS